MMVKYLLLSVPICERKKAELGTSAGQFIKLADLG